MLHSPQRSLVRTYISPIGYDTRRVTRPVVNTGLSGDDEVRLLRPSAEADTERATQAVADVKQLLHEIEPEATCSVTKVSIDSFEATVRDCCELLSGLSGECELIVSLSGGARDVLLPLLVAAVVFNRKIQTTLFFSDLDSTVREWTLPELTTQVPTRTFETFETIIATDGWLTLSALATETGNSKSTVIRHVNDLDDAGIVETDTSEKVKRVRYNFSGELFWMAQEIDQH